jgi:NitT/TauT family transport system ATP-binding protein
MTPRELSMEHLNVDLGSAPQRVLDDVSLHLRKGEIVALVGPSGCGKSTLLRTAVGLQRATSGSVELRGEPVRGPVRGMSIVFQDYELFDWMTVLENVSFGLKARGVPPTQREQRSRELLRLVGLEHDAKQYPAQLSGGMRQRGAIARALAVDPPVLLLDEPFGSLDFMTRRTLQEDLAAIWSARGTSVLLVTHAMDEAIYLADRVVVMRKPPASLAVEFIIDAPRPRAHNWRLQIDFLYQVSQIESAMLSSHRSRSS